MEVCLAAGVKAYHKRCRECGHSKGKPKPKAKPKPKTKPRTQPVQLAQPRQMPKPDHGRKLRQAVDRIERRAAIQRDTALARRIRGARY